MRSNDKSEASARPARPASRQLGGMPEQGKQYIVMWVIALVVGCVAIAIGADLQTLVAVLAVSVLFVVLVSRLVDRMI